MKSSAFSVDPHFVGKKPAGVVPAPRSAHVSRKSVLLRASLNPSPKSLSRTLSTPLGPGLSPSTSFRSTSPSVVEDESDESTHLNALCFPDVVLHEEPDVFEERTSVGDAPCCPWPLQFSSAAPLELYPKFMPYEPDGSNSEFCITTSGLEGQASLTQQDLWRRAAALAVQRSEDNYRKAWTELQNAERRLQSTRLAATEVEEFCSTVSRSCSDQSVDIPVLPSLASHCEQYADNGSTAMFANDIQCEEPTVDLGWGDGVWCIETCTAAPSGPPSKADECRRAESADIEGQILNAEGAMAKSRAALDAAAKDLVVRLQEQNLQAEVMDHHIDALDQGAEHQAARWLVEEMDAMAAGPYEGSQVKPEDSLSLSVPLDLNLAMQGYDEHAVRFLRHLPYDKVLKIRTVPPSPVTRQRQLTSSAADTFERILSQPSGQPATPKLELHHREPSPGTVAPLALPVPDDSPLVGGLLVKEDTGKAECGSPLALEVVDAPHEEAFILMSSGSNSSVGSWSCTGSSEDLGKRYRRRGRYHSKLVILGCCICTLAAYMVANFELSVLAKDVAVIVTAMSLAFAAAKFVLRSGGTAPQAADGDGPLSDSVHFSSADQARNDLHSSPRAAPSVSPGQDGVRRRGPSWDQVIWLIGGFAVVLSVSTMVALACKAAQAGLLALSTLACSLIVRVLALGPELAVAASFHHSVPTLVHHVSTSLWLVVGGELLSSGVESLGSAAAWAMLLLCVAFSIASAPICIASSTSRRVSELLALARSHSGSRADED